MKISSPHNKNIRKPEPIRKSFWESCYELKFGSVYEINFIAIIFTHTAVWSISKNFNLKVNRYALYLYVVLSCLSLYAYIGDSNYFSFSKILIHRYSILETLIEIKGIIGQGKSTIKK